MHITQSHAPHSHRFYIVIVVVKSPPKSYPITTLHETREMDPSPYLLLATYLPRLLDHISYLDRLYIYLYLSIYICI